MALSPRGCPTENLVAFCNYAEAIGARVGEMPPWDAAKAGAHSKGSWHYDKDGKYGQAADINYGTSGSSTSENDVLDHLRIVGESMGLGVIWRSPGHYTHLHADVGTWSRFNGNGYTRMAGDIVTYKIQGAVHFPAKERDNLWGDNTDDRIEAVRYASNLHGVKFPKGAKAAQIAVGTKADNVWGNNSRAAHDATVAAIQRILGVTADGIWGKKTEAAYLSARKSHKI